MDSNEVELKVFQKCIENKFLTCFICYDILNEPKILQCLHTYCKSCIKKHLETSSQNPAKCPLCAKNIKIPPTGIDGLQKNFYVENLILEVRGKNKINIEDYKTKTESILETMNEQIKSIGVIYVQIEKHCHFLTESVNEMASRLKQSLSDHVFAYDEFCNRLTQLSDECKEKLFVQQEKMKRVITNCEDLKQKLLSAEERPDEVDPTTMKEMEASLHKTVQLHKIAEVHINDCKKQAACFLDYNFYGGPDVRMSDIGIISPK